jgi:hypothetical protein
MRGGTNAGERMNGPILAALRRAAGNDTREVRDTRKKKGKQCGTKEQQRCTTDAAACRPLVLAVCGNNEECVADALPCCDTCSADGFVTCLLLAGSDNNTIARFA